MRFGSIRKRYVTIITVLLLLSLILMLPMIRPVREQAAELVLNKLRAGLPGNIAIARAEWPSPNSFSLTGLIWTEGSDTLLHLDSLSLKLDLAALTKRDLVLKALSLECRFVDIPGIQDIMATTTPTEAVESSGGGMAFPRAGALPPIPSVAIESASLNCDRLIAGDGRALSGIRTHGAFDLRTGDSPRFRFEIAARDAAGAWSMDTFELDWSPAESRFAGEGRLDIAGVDPVQMILTGTGQKTFRLEIGALDSAAGSPGLSIDGALGGGRGEARTLDLEGRFLSPGPRRLAGLIDPETDTRKWADLEPPAGSLAISGQWDETGPSARIDLDMTAANWLDDLRLKAAYRSGRTSVDTLVIRMSGLDLDASASLRENRMEAVAVIQTDGLAWLQAVQPDLQAPDSLATRTTLAINGTLPHPAISIALGGGARLDQTRIDHFGVDFSLAEDWPGGDVAWALQVEDLRAAGAAEISNDANGISLRTTPVDIAFRAEPVLDVADGVVRWTPADSTLDISDFRLTGALGDGLIDATWRPGDNRIRAAMTWARLPGIAALVLSIDQMAALGNQWNDGDPWALLLDASSTRATDGIRQYEAVADLRLPGPNRLSVLSPRAFALDDLGDIEGRARVSGTIGNLSADLDLSKTSWLREAHAALRVRDRVIDIDTVRIHMPGLSVDGGGRIDAGMIDARMIDAWANLELADLSVPARFAAITPDTEAAAQASIRMKGTLEQPEIAARLEGRYRQDNISAPDIRGEATVSGRSLMAWLDLPEGIDLAGVHLDTASISFMDPGSDANLARVSARAVSATSSLAFAGTVESGDIWTIVTDTLSLSVDDRQLDLEQPFSLVFQNETRKATVDSIALSGSLGHLQAGLETIAGAIRGTANLFLTPNPDTYPSGIPAGMTPDSLSLQLDFDGDRQTARLMAYGLQPGGRFPLTLESHYSLSPEAINARAMISGPDLMLASFSAQVPGNTLELHKANNPVPIIAELELSDMPITDTGHGSDKTYMLGGNMRIKGTTAAPEAELDLIARVNGWEDLSAHKLRIKAGLTPTTEASNGRLFADISLDRANKTLATGHVNLPGTATLYPPIFTADQSGLLETGIKITGLNLDEFSPLLPSAVGLRGTLDLDLAARGNPETAAVTGQLALSNGQISLADGSWLTLKGKSTLAGDIKSPAVDGSFTIGRGVLQLPEPPKLLHPIDARPLLWDIAGTAEIDTIISVKDRPSFLEALLPDISPRAEIRLAIPSGFWLRGQGLDIELTGDLDARVQDNDLTIIGDLEAVRGICRFLGRTFQIESGRVVFDGEEVENPLLDITLTTHIDGGLYRIAFGGNVRKPTMILSSEPELTEGDIMSTLLFGRPLDELSSEQENVVQDRATDLISAFGTAQLEARLSQQLKVDMVSLRRGGQAGDDESLVIGKYIHQKVLLKYEQVLDEWSTFFVNLEYFLSRHFKVETMMSRHSQSAASINWTLEY